MSNRVLSCFLIQENSANSRSDLFIVKFQFNSKLLLLCNFCMTGKKLMILA